MTNIRNGSPLISDGWHEVRYTSGTGDDGLYHKRAWFNGVLVYNDLMPYSGETSNERRWGFNSAAYMGEWHLDYFGIYDEGAVFLPPVLQSEFDGNTLTLSWDYGVLQHADHLPAAPGAWEDVPGATNPHVITFPAADARKFFRWRLQSV